MVLAAGLTPAYQQILLFDSLHLGEVNRAREAHFCASGKTLNVANALHHLGGDCLSLTVAGGAPGDAIQSEFRSFGVPHRWIRSRCRTRICTTLIDRGAGVTTELVESGSALEPDEILQFCGAYEEEASRAAVVVLSGSLPAATPKAFYRSLMERTAAPIVLDASGEELLQALPLRPFCVKPNRQELGRTLGNAVNSDADVRDAIRQVHQMGAQWVMVSSGAHALWVSDGRQFWSFHPPHLAAVNPIASGDCLAAGFAWALREGMPVLDAVRFGMAAAAENAAALLPARLDLSRVRNRLPEIGMETL